jgi:hypothetical protein
MAELFHVSEDAGIRLFEPRVPSAEGEPVVWAIDEQHLPNYLLPRDCPRVTFFAAETTSPEDVERYLLGSTGRVIAIEATWLDRVARASLVRYGFERAGFEPKDRVAGYYVSRVPVEPVAEVLIDNLPGALVRLGVELRILPSLWELRERVIRSTLGFSIIRMRNATPPAEGYEAYHPLPA